MKGLLKQDHEVLFQRIRTFRDKLTSANHEGGFFNLLRGLKPFMLSLMDYRQDCKTVFIVWYTAVLCVNAPRALRDDTKNCCVADWIFQVTVLNHGLVP